MKKEVIVKSALCMAAALTVMASIHAPKLTSATLSTETGLAGISISLDKFYSAENADPVAVMSQVMSAQTNEAAKQVVEPESTVEPVSEYADTGISIADDYVNIRKEPNTDSEILGKLYEGSAAKILKQDDKWVKIKSGKVEGYINTEFLAIGFSAEELVDKYGTKWAKVNTTTLKVREDKSIDATVLTLVPLGEEFEVVKEYDEWVKILIDEGNEGSEATVGYVSKEYVDIRVEFKQAISVEEEQAKAKAEEEARRAEEEAAAKLAEREKNNQNNNSSNNNSNNNNSNNNSSNNNSNNNTSNNDSSDFGKVVGSGSGAEIASFALKFVGNPYVYGGTSLTNGADCSGFVQSVFKSFGIGLPRTSSSQSTVGKKIDVSDARAGDLIFYGSNGSVGHVAICIGGGQVVHASNKKTGIKVSNIYYRTPYGARRVVE